MGQDEMDFPRLALRLLSAMLPAAQQAEILGDLAEGYQLAAAEHGRIAAGTWLWSQVLVSLPAFLIFSLQPSQLRSQTVNGSILFREGKTSAAVSALFLLPAVMIVIPGLLFSAFGKPVEASLNSVPGFASLAAWADKPWVVLGGLALALLVNLAAVAGFKVEVIKEKFQATLSLKKSVWNLVLLGLTVFLGATLLAYLIGENILPLL